MGKYQILSEQGRGGFATVYRALDTMLNREVALKILHPQLLTDPTFVERFKRDVSDTDRYGRLLRYVYVGDTFVNAELVRAGLTRAFALWPDTGCAKEFARLEKEARRQRRGDVGSRW